jgi:hypothetical protein
MRDTGRDVGFDMRWVDADDLVFFFQASPARQQAVLDEIAAACRDGQPDILVADCFFQPPGHNLPPEALIAFFRDLKAATGVRIVAFFTDAHEAPQQAAIAAGPAYADLIWHFEPSIPQMAVPEVAARTLLRMQPLPDLGHAPDRPERTIPAAFVGSIIRHPVRAYWMSLVERHGTPLTPMLSGHRVSEAGAAPTMADYAELLGRIRTNVNFTRMNIHSNPGNGRIFRSTLSGCLAFEEDNADTPHFFAPYVHYIPFRDIGGLDRWLRFFAGNDDWRRRIAARGQDWCRRHYSKEAVWAAILARLDDGGTA